MEKSILVILLIGLFMTGCARNDPISTNPNTADIAPSQSGATDVPEYLVENTLADTTPSQSRPTDVPEYLAENMPAWHRAYAPYISAYIAFENGGQPADIICTPFIKNRWTATYSANYCSEEAIVFALYDINGNGSTELIIGRRFGSEQEGYYFNVCDVYTVDGGSLNRIIACYPNDEFCTINTRSIEFVEGNIIRTKTEYSLSSEGTLIEEHSISIAMDSIDFEANKVVHELGNPLSDTPAELEWKHLSEYTNAFNAVGERLF
jgi:hypothetical protein